jgi:RND family efflux transporter MFP subunit
MKTAVFAAIFAMINLGLPATSQEALRPVKLMTVTSKDDVLARQFFGQVVARQTVQVSGQVMEIPAVEGQSIEKGDLIAQLDLEPFQLALDQARLQENQARRTLERLEKLSGNTVSQVTVDDANTQEGLAKIAVRNAEYNLRHATLSAPFDALVATRNLDNFTTIATGTPVVRLHDMSELRIDIDVPEVLFQRAGEDPNVEIVAKFPTSDRLFPLQVREFNAETSGIGQTFRLTFGLAPPDDMVILPGSSVTVIARLNLGTQETVSPPSAVGAEPDGATFVMVFVPEADGNVGTIKKTPVEISPNVNGDVLVTSGLNEGDEIVVAGVPLLSDGTRVTRFTGFSN